MRTIFQLLMMKCFRFFGACVFCASLLVSPASFAQAPEKPKINTPQAQRWHLIVLEIIDSETETNISTIAGMAQQLGLYPKGTNTATIGPGAFNLWTNNPLTIKSIIKKFGEPNTKTQVVKETSGKTGKVDYDVYGFDDKIFFETERGKDSVAFITAPASWLTSGIRKVALKEAEKAKSND